MQPNQSNPNSQNMTTSSGANIPEYLHMDPIVEQKHNGKKNSVIVVSIVTLLFLVVGGIIANWYADYISPQQTFYRALDNMLQTKYVAREFIEEYRALQSKRNVALYAETDLSVPNSPKTSMKFSDETTKDSKTTTKTTGKIIEIGNQRMTQLSSIFPLREDITLNQWSTRSLNLDAQEFNYDLAQVDMSASINNAQGVLAIGYFGDNQRKELIKFIQDNNVYTIESTRNDVIDNEKTYVYTIDIDREKLNKLNEKIAALIGVKRKSVINTDALADSTLELSVQVGSSKFTKLMYTTGQDSDSTSFKKTIEYSYPATLSITTPDKTKGP